jgi:hypothetical protein
MIPSAAAVACRVETRKVGRTAVTISCPASEKKLLAPIPRIPRLIQVLPAAGSL